MKLKIAGLLALILALVMFLGRNQEGTFPVDRMLSSSIEGSHSGATDTPPLENAPLLKTGDPLPDAPSQPVIGFEQEGEDQDPYEFFDVESLDIDTVPMRAPLELEINGSSCSSLPGTQGRLPDFSELFGNETTVRMQFAERFPEVSGAHVERWTQFWRTGDVSHQVTASWQMDFPATYLVEFSRLHNGIWEDAPELAVAAGLGSEEGYPLGLVYLRLRQVFTQVLARGGALGTRFVNLVHDRLSQEFVRFIVQDARLVGLELQHAWCERPLLVEERDHVVCQCKRLEE